jgi:hypothetical protein
MKEQTIKELTNLITEMVTFMPTEKANEYLKKLIEINENK